METLRETLKTLIKAASPVDEAVELTQATQAKFGHYQCNSAMKWAKTLQRSPRDIAQEMVAKLDQSCFAKVEIAGPGFINLTLSESFLSQAVNDQLNDPHMGVPLPKKPQRIVIDFSAPNIAKEMHVGHLRSTIIGDCLARLFEFLGHDVLRLNHVGDWGTAFGMLIVYMQEEGKDPKDLPTLMQWYRASKVRFDSDEAFKERAREAVVKLQGGDIQARHLWECICQISRDAFRRYIGF